MNAIAAKPDVDRVLQLVCGIATSLVDHEDGISVSASTGTECTLIELRTAHGEVGQVIGKEGRISKAIHTILNAHSAKAGHRFSLEILE